MHTEVIEQIWIEMPDGCRLGARLWLPEGARSLPVPAVLEYIPYRKRDGTRGRDEPMHGYFAQQGYAAIRVDMRGSGESEGHMADEYLQQEQDDACAVIAWIAAQEWCDGNVGMMGKSWGGFNGLQVAACRPPALKAVITAYSTDDRFRDDIHFMGGCLLNDNLWWGTIMMGYQARPLDPAVVGEGWRAAWEDRLDRIPFFPALWAAHQSYDEYWKHGSVQEDYSAIECPVLVIGGWADSYTNPVPRLLENLTVPCRGIIGPWGHIFPQDGVPGPAIGFLQEATRWWDHWLKGRDTGVMAEPKLRAFINDPVEPVTSRPAQPGRWVSEPAWPSPEITARDFHLGASGELSEAPVAGGQLTLCSPQSLGAAAGEWMGVGCPGDMPADQRLDDGGALVFETPALAAEVEILGTPQLRLRLASDKPVAQIAVRLSDVNPSGSVTRVSYQVLNLTHRTSHETPEPLVPGEMEEVSITLSMCGHRFAPGHRIRIALSTAYWPILWPAPEAATLTLDTAASRLTLPVRKGGDGGVAFEAPLHGVDAPQTMIRPAVLHRSVTTDLMTGVVTYVTDGQGGLFGEGVLRFDETGTVISHSLRRELSIHPNDPSSACYKLHQDYELGREGWQTRSVISSEMRCDGENFYLSAEMKVTLNGEEVRRRSWAETLPRNLI
ncbi:CocE/NonD family hydrolase [Rhodobacter lacus]|uniref:CocE/NonD family hydrolase n=1 Tax=Rhodobacter lacus TaxID=1641972 RepID=A0ABW5A7L8_9RHOB